MFVGVHVLLAEKTDLPELAITMDEGKAFMGAAQNVMRHYSVETTQKTLDWLAFIGTAASMYAPRAVAISVRSRREKGPQVVRRPGVEPAQSPAPTVAIVPDQFAAFAAE